MVPTRSNYDEIKFKQIYYAGEVHEIYYVYIMENMKKKLSPEHYLILCRLCVLMILYYDTGFGGGEGIARIAPPQLRASSAAAYVEKKIIIIIPTNKKMITRAMDGIDIGLSQKRDWRE